jgi:hypothetical protein
MWVVPEAGGHEELIDIVNTEGVRRRLGQYLMDAERNAARHPHKPVPHGNGFATLDGSRSAIVLTRRPEARSARDPHHEKAARCSVPPVPLDLN